MVVENKKKIFLPSSYCLVLNFFKTDGISDIHFVFKDQTYLNFWNLFFFAETCDYVEKNKTTIKEHKKLYNR